jgi:hypothetical protein
VFAHKQSVDTSAYVSQIYLIASLEFHDRAPAVADLAQGATHRGRLPLRDSPMLIRLVYA